MASRTQRELDSLDWKLLRELQDDARLSYNELARRVGLSAPAVAERVRRMEDAGVIAAYRAEVDPAKIGLPVMALVHLRCDHDKCLLKTASPAAYPEIVIQPTAIIRIHPKRIVSWGIESDSLSARHARTIRGGE